MLLMIKSGIRGGIATISHRHAKANNEYMGTEFDPAEESKFISHTHSPHHPFNPHMPKPPPLIPLPTHPPTSSPPPSITTTLSYPDPSPQLPDPPLKTKDRSPPAISINIMPTSRRLTMTTVSDYIVISGWIIWHCHVDVAKDEEDMEKLYIEPCLQIYLETCEQIGKAIVQVCTFASSTYFQPRYHFTYWLHQSAYLSTVNVQAKMWTTILFHCADWIKRMNTLTKFLLWLIIKPKTSWLAVKHPNQYTTTSHICLSLYLFHGQVYEFAQKEAANISPPKSEDEKEPQRKKKKKHRSWNVINIRLIILLAVIVPLHRTKFS